MVIGRTLILCIDRDDDLGYKAGVRSPIIGRAACLDAASTLALADPEDSDVNAIFQAVKTHDELAGRGEEVEVVILTGNHMHMLEGDRKIGDDLDRVLEKTRVSSCILISDGVEDEYVLPIIQSRLPVSGIRRVIVAQMPNLEGTYYIIKKLLDDPKVARTVLIPVGLGMLIYAIAYLIGLGVEAHQKAGQNVTRITVSGGIARSDLMCEILASVLGRRLERLESAEGPALGAAVTALAALESHRRKQQGIAQPFTVADAVAVLVKYAEPVDPNPDWTAAYRQRFASFGQRLAELRNTQG